MEIVVYAASGQCFADAWEVAWRIKRMKRSAKVVLHFNEKRHVVNQKQKTDEIAY